LGPIADQVAGEMRETLRAGPDTQAKPAAVPDASKILAALGGRDNVREVDAFAGRLLVRANRPEIVDERALTALGIRGIARTTGAPLQLLVAGSAAEWVEPLRRMLAAI